MNKSRLWAALARCAVVLLLSLLSFAQTVTYHLHKTSSSTPGYLVLSTASPDGSNTIVQTVDLNGKAVGTYLIKNFNTQAGDPNAAGVIPAGSTVSAVLWMKTTANLGTMYPFVRFRLNDANGTALCNTTGTAALTTTVTQYNLSCTTTANTTVAATDRLCASVGISLTQASSSGSFMGAIGIEGTLNGRNDSRSTFPLPNPPPTVSSLAPSTGAIGSAIVIAGSNFGSSQGTSTVTFNGTTASVSSWSSASITAAVPAGATTGPVIVTVAGQASAGVTYTVTPPPSVTSLSLSSGAVGSTVTISGAYFGSTQGNGFVKFSGVNATVASWSDTAISVTVPSGAVTGNVVVTAAGGISSNGVVFTVVPAPSILTLSPGSGSTGASVTISGSNFGVTQGNGYVKFNGVTASVSSWTNGSIAATVPVGATTGAVIVTAAGGVSSNGVTFSVVSPPSITSLSPNLGTVGTSITVTGANFGSTQGSSVITFNGIVASPTSWGPTSIVVPVPTGATTGNVLIVSGGVGSNGVLFTVGSGPSLISVSPSSGSAGTPVTVTGMNLGNAQGNSSLTFNGTPATATSWNSGSVIVNVPQGATTGNVVVNVGGIVSNAINFTVTAGSPPSISSVSPNASPSGTPITIYGSNFGSSQNSSTITFNGTAATPLYWNAGLIVVPVPASASTGNIVVTVGGVPSAGVNFTVATVPTISSAPTAGRVGQSIQIVGTNFGASQGSSTVSFNGTNSTPTSWSSTLISVPVPAGSTNGNITVTVNGLASNAVPFVVSPGIISVSPDLGTPGTPVTVTGTNFGATQGTSTVSLGTLYATPTSWSDTSITANVPTGSSTGSTIVTVAGYPSNAVAFNVGSSPTLTSLSSSSGAVGSVIILTGTNFGSSNGNSVTFNGTVASTSSWTSTQITTSVPASATTGGVVVTVGGVSSNALNFTVTAGPGVNRLSPTSGGFGSSIGITGAGFGSSQSSSTVMFNGVNATTVTSWSDGFIQANVPAGASTGSVIVNVGGVNSNPITFTVNANPTIVSLSTNSGAINTPLTINGYSFGAAQGSVTINGTSATVTSWGQTAINVTVPPGATTGNVVVTSSGTQSNGYAFTVRAGINSISPPLGSIGTSVTLTGTGFGAVQGSSTLTFFTFQATTITPTMWSDTSIKFTVPSNAQSYDTVYVTVNGVNSNAVAFTVGATPTITSISPSSGPVGSPTTVSGQNFLSYPPTGVTFNGVSATNVTSITASALTAVVPLGATTGPVVVSNAGSPSNGMTFTVTSGPGLTSLSRTSGAIGATVILTGQGFGSTQGTSTVSFNGVSAPITSWSNTSVLATVPTGATTGNLLLTVNGTPTNALLFTITSPAVVSSLSPSASQYGASVTLTGSGFGSTSSGSSVVVGGSGVNISSWSDTSITFYAPTPTGDSVVVDPVYVTTASSGVPSNTVQLTLLPRPSITRLSTSAGPVGTAVTVTGTGFGPIQGAGTVTFGGSSAVPTSWSDTSITAAVPTLGSTGDVIVTANGVSSTPNYTIDLFKVTPNILSLTPLSGSINTPVTIVGSGFGSGTTNGVGCSQTTSTVSFTCPSSSCFGATTIASHASTWTTNSIIAPVPNLASTGPVTVSVCGVVSNGISFTVPSGTGGINGTMTRALDGAPVAGATVTAMQGGTVVATTSTLQNGTYNISSLAAGTYDVQASGPGYVTSIKTGNTVTAGNNTNVSLILGTSPVVANISPTWGIVGTSVTINGSNFGSTQLGSTVTFNGIVAAPTSWSSVAIVVPVPSGASTGSVVVTVGGAASNAVNFVVGSGSVAGTITNSSTGTGISGALAEALQNNAVHASASTGLNGTYTIPSLSPGTYDLRMSASGFGTQLFPGSIVTANSTLTVNAALGSPGTVSGKVTLPDGVTPIVGAAVTASQSNVTAASMTTDSGGHFSLSSLSPGSYTMQAAASGYSSQSQSGVTVTVSGNTTVNFSLTGQSTINYSYDELGRLTQVADSLNGAATYQYDAVGNITSIARTALNQVTVSSFVPKSGVVGSTVTINGTGFSSTISQNAVSFGGASASVSAASPTQLQATVPSGASSGSITVTAPGGSATSTGSFTVLSSGTSPSLTGFSPPVVASGDTFSINGTNFDSTPVNDRITFGNGVGAITTVATTTSLTSTTPSNAMSGKLTVTTPAGTAVSAGDIFVAPPPTPASSVGYTGRASAPFPSTQTVTLGVNQYGLLLFDGIAGQKFTLATANSTFSDGCKVPGSVVSPNGTVVASHGCLGSSNVIIDATTMPTTGTYTVELAASIAGHVDVTVGTVAPDITGALLLNGPAVTANITTWGQNALYTFNGTAGHTVTINVSQETISGVNMYVFNPDGSQLGFKQYVGTGGTFGPLTLPSTGTYVFKIDPFAGSQYVGTVVFTISGS